MGTSAGQHWGGKGVPSLGTESEKSRDHSLRNRPTQERCCQGHRERKKGSGRRGRRGLAQASRGDATAHHYTGFTDVSSKGGNVS